LVVVFFDHLQVFFYVPYLYFSGLGVWEVLVEEYFEYSAVLSECVSAGSGVFLAADEFVDCGVFVFVDFLVDFGV